MAPPVSRVAVGFALGVAAAAVPGAVPLALTAAAILWAPIRAWHRPTVRGLAVALIAGLAAGVAHARVRAGCPEPVPGPGAWTGRALASAAGASVPFELQTLERCPEERVWSRDALPVGRPVRIEGARREGWGRGIIVVDEVAPLPEARQGGRWRRVRWRARLVERVRNLYGDRASVVTALVLARREGLDRDVRDDFARSGTAHLLAISGFHVGVIAGLLLALAGLGGLPRNAARLVSVVGTWGYVALIGAPDAAARAALIFTFMAVGRLRGRPASRWGALGSALLLLLLLDPSRLEGPGFQLSFAGAAGLAAWGRSVRTALAGGPVRMSRELASALAAGVAATLATMPVVAWHFEQVALLGIPTTLIASPLVALALPGAIVSVALEPLFPGAAAFLAGGVGLLLDALVAVVSWVGDRPWASLWVPRGWVVVGVAGFALAWEATRRSRTRGPARRAASLLAAAAAIVAWPLLLGLQGRGTLEFLVLDVGQGDAIALRTPRGRWLLVDAGPPGGDGSPPAAVQELARKGIVRLDALVLTHADADHIGGAAEILERLPVGFVLDPGEPVGKEGYLEVLRAAERRRVPWRRARAGLHWVWDGVGFSVLAPIDSLPSLDTNARSVVLLVRFGAFEALLTGDAPTEVERAVLPELPAGGLEVLKVGHHGSATSTDSVLLARTAPKVALVSVGRGNPFGHPVPSVLARLRRFGVELHRTDREGTLRLRARADGSVTLQAAREGGARR